LYRGRTALRDRNGDLPVFLTEKPRDRGEHLHPVQTTGRGCVVNGMLDA
jgi:hypothetical protein